ncbi:hypothetical protein MUP38_06000 [Candidatus Bathyarchaeota archaeon]|nr:hypothetical protein [Candidatus Bathyarchaeota archaeon]
MDSAAFGPVTKKWLTALTDSTRSTYTPGIAQFQDYLNAQSFYPAIRTSDDFLKAVQEDNKMEMLERKFMDRELMKGFVAYMLGNKLAPKTVRTYVGGVQSLGNFWKIPISTDYAELPPAIETNEKYPWSIEKVGSFIKSMDSPMYRCLSVWYLQTGLSNYDLLTMKYGKVREQLESGVLPICLNLVRFKTRRFEVRFRAFIGSLGVRFFKEYVSEMEPLTDDDLIFQVSSNAVEGYFARRAATFLPEGYTGRNPCCPSSLRTGFRTFRSDATCPADIIEYWMGHNLTQDLKKKYTNKSDDSWRVTYQEYETVLTFKV